MTEGAAPRRARQPASPPLADSARDRERKRERERKVEVVVVVIAHNRRRQDGGQTSTMGRVESSDCNSSSGDAIERSRKSRLGWLIRV